MDTLEHARKFVEFDLVRSLDMVSNIASHMERKKTEEELSFSKHVDQ